MDILTIRGDMNDLTDSMVLNTDELGQVFNRPVYNMQEIMVCSEQESIISPEEWKRIVFLQIDSIAFRDRRDIRTALGVFYGVLHAMNTSFWYIIKGDSSEGTIKLYIGSIPDEYTKTRELTHSLLGIMPGCQICKEMSNRENQELIGALGNFS